MGNLDAIAELRGLAVAQLTPHAENIVGEELHIQWPAFEATHAKQSMQIRELVC